MPRVTDATPIEATDGKTPSSFPPPPTEPANYPIITTINEAVRWFGWKGWWKPGGSLPVGDSYRSRVVTLASYIKRQSYFKQLVTYHND